MYIQCVVIPVESIDIEFMSLCSAELNSFFSETIIYCINQSNQITNHSQFLSLGKCIKKQLMCFIATPI